MNDEPLGSEVSRGQLKLFVLLSFAAAVGLSSAIRFPVFDDEANAINNAAVGLPQIISSGLGRNHQFHPPLCEVVLHSWLAVTGSMCPAVVRVPAIAFWVAALGALYWALMPIASVRARLAAVAAVILWPAHLLLPFSATWYSLAALLSVVSLGALFRALSASSPRKAFVASMVAAVATIALAYTVFAWPFVTIGELVAAKLIFGAIPFRKHSRTLIGAGAIVALAVLPTITAIFARVGPMLHREAGGGPLQSIGAFLGLLVGHSAPAAPLLLCFVIISVLGVLVGILGAERRVWSLVLAGLVSLGCLAATNTLNDKRLLLGSVLVPAGLGLRINERRGRFALALCALAAIPAWLGWTRMIHAPWIFPRWQDPVDEIAALHSSALAPRVLVTTEPEIAFPVARLDDQRRLWQFPSEGPVDGTSFRWRTWRPDLLRQAIENQGRYTGIPIHTIDIVLSTKMQDREIATRDALESDGWHVVDERDFGLDPWSRFRHPGAGLARFHFVRLDRNVER